MEHIFMPATSEVFLNFLAGKKSGLIRELMLTVIGMLLAE